MTSTKSTIVAITSREYDRVDLSTLRYWKRYWKRVDDRVIVRNACDANVDANVEIAKLSREIDARENARAMRAQRVVRVSNANANDAREIVRVARVTHTRDATRRDDDET